MVNTDPAVTTTYDQAGLPVSSSDGTTYSHDQVGNLTAIDRTGGTNDWLFTYSSWNKLTKAERSPGSSDVAYTLDALDRMLSRTASGSTADYTYQGAGEVLAKSVVAGMATLYAHTPGGPLAQKQGSTTRYYLRDFHGDLIGWANTSGSLVGTALYDPWGQPLSATGEMATVPPDGALRFQSDLTDASTGQVDMLTRLYEPTLVRFGVRDVLFGDPLNPLSLNLHVYGAANPVTYWDPTGMVPVEGGTGQCDQECQEDAEEAVESTGGSYECVDCSPAVRTAELPSATAYTDVMFDEGLSIWERFEAAQDLIAMYGAQGMEIVVDWLAGMRLAEEASIWHQATSHLGESFLEGLDQVAWGEFTPKVVQCVYTGAQSAVAMAPVGAAFGAGEVVWLVATFAVGCGVGVATPVEWSSP